MTFNGNFTSLIPQFSPTGTFFSETHSSQVLTQKVEPIISLAVNNYQDYPPPAFLRCSKCKQEHRSTDILSHMRFCPDSEVAKAEEIETEVLSFYQHFVPFAPFQISILFLSSERILTLKQVVCS